MSKKNTGDMLINKAFVQEENDAIKDVISMIKEFESSRMHLYKYAQDKINTLKCIPELSDVTISSEEEIEEINSPEVSFDGEKIKMIIPDFLPSIYIKTSCEALNYFSLSWKMKICKSLTKLISENEGLHYNQVFIWIKLFLPVETFDCDNRYFKPIIDGIVSSKLVKDDDYKTVKFGIQGKSELENPHTEITIYGDEHIPKAILNL